MYNYCLVISYDGSFFYGSQFQYNFKTVESELKNLMSILFKAELSLIFSGRTDRGVHANGMVVNFFASFFITPSAIKDFVNKKSNYIKIQHISLAPFNFHSRRSALKREYSYLLTNDSIPVYLLNYITHTTINLNFDFINNFLSHLVGTHDFTFFKKEGSIINSPIRTIFYTNCSLNSYKLLTDLNKTIMIYKIVIIGNSFLYRMIRNIVGCMLKLSLDSLESDLNLFLRVFKNNDNNFKYKPAAPCGLYLDKIYY